MVRFLGLSVFLLPYLLLDAQVAAPPLAPTSPRAQESQPVADGTNNRLITLDVRVTDSSGAAVRGLQERDFTILDGKDQLAIGSFRAVDSKTSPDVPVEVVLVIDDVNASLHSVSYERDQIKGFLTRNGGNLAYPMRLVVFSDGGTKVQNGATQDGNALAALLDKYELGLRTITRSQGFWGAADRLSMSLKTLNSLAAYEAGKPGRKLMIWISPGWPFLSGPGVELSSKQEQQIFASIVGASTVLRDARITLYSIDPIGVGDNFRQAYYQEFLKPVTTPARVLPGDLSLQVLAIQSGGRVFNGSNDLASSVAGCVSDADGFYTLSFTSRPADRVNEYHPIKILVDKPKLIARTRAGYYAQP